MQVQLNTDANVQGRDSLAAWAERELNDKLVRALDTVLGRARGARGRKSIRGDASE